MDWRCHCCYHLNTSDNRICTRCGLLGKRKIINLKEERKENISPGRGVPKLRANIGGDERGREAAKFQHQGNLVSSPRTSPTHAEVVQRRPDDEYLQKRRGSQDKRTGNKSPIAMPSNVSEEREAAAVAQFKWKENISLFRGAPMLGANAGGDERARNVSTPSAAAAKVPSSSVISGQRTPPSPRHGQFGGKVDEYPRGGSQEKVPSSSVISSQRTPPSPTGRRGQLGGKVDEYPRGGSQEKDELTTISKWTCIYCTLVNEPGRNRCEVCGKEAPLSALRAVRPGTAKKVEQTEVLAASSPKKYNVPASGPKSIRNEIGFTCKCSKCSTNIPRGKLYCPNCTRFGDTRSSQL